MFWIFFMAAILATAGAKKLRRRAGELKLTSEGIRQHELGSKTRIDAPALPTAKPFRCSVPISDLQLTENEPEPLR
ncbi:hypothetical protein F2P81_010269 [Scophthalmus maximus]|uniref:Uncharacterized protein n=1 Tax=Scophthalmus maximus TaxID=52904 RepID=A0A6A4SXD2_SCOMX|nr:hypothetical protein F2P81_010269 [Scophthalmus maximus]